MSELDLTEIKVKSTKGIIALVQRTFLIQIIGFISTGFFAAFLSLEHWGVFGVVNSLIAFLTYFSDVGLAGALIQKKASLTHDDLSTTFTIQQFLVITIVLLGMLCSNFVGNFYGLGDDGIWLFRALLFSFFLSSLKTIPSIILERNLDFQKMVIPQIIEPLVFNLVTIYCAWRGMGITSFTYGVTARAVTGLLALYVIAPWRISVGLNINVAKRLFRFGIPFQSNSFLALLKDDLMILFLGKVLSLDALGYISFAKKTSELPLRTIMDNVTRVTFPAFSRLQHDKKLLGRVLDRTTFGIAACVLPVFVGMMFFFQPLIQIIPKYQKWEGATISFLFFCIASIAASISTPLTNALNAVGKIKITLYFMIGWVISTWLLVLFFIRLYGFNGFALALMVIAVCSVFIVVYVVKQIIPYDFFSNISRPVLSTLPQILLYGILIPKTPHTVVSLIFLGSAGVFVYFLTLWVLDKKNLIIFMKLFQNKNN